MDTRSGNILTPEEFAKVPLAQRKYFRQMEVEPTPQQMARKPPKVGRNEPCPCNSGKKFKRCCLFTEALDAR